MTTINLPDHPVRQSRWYQIYARLARPTLDWVTVGSVSYVGIIGPWTGNAVSEGYLVQILMFATATFGIRTYEKVKGVA
ncbi:hypothetical protein BSL82_15580 [Tardibacter chloracetimidivorans]|uniref:Uncharacterized protein n=1 Tax=Tardibacter chloracetimidivorans TaxID=1921510 RepID=A0A1L3ZY35_9SPHN|nr:hypothetical protein [Tardibacter chloracetimidivorans]API60525.1 hypothetical protein BSL82_15580 [Tardibacter chloracetimidivorans]